MIKGKKLKNSVKIGYNFFFKFWIEFFNEILNMVKYYF